MKENKKKLISVIVPAFRQAKTIQRDLKNIEEVLKTIRYDYEIICVIDGKLDKTYNNAAKVASDKISVIGYKNNRGKGFAVRYGMARAKGDLIAFIDAGMDIDPNGISMILEHMEWYGADIIVGSKRHPASEIKYPITRRILSFITQIIVRLLLDLKVRDTQVGLKVFKRKVLEDTLPRLLLKRFAFDVELLAVAKRIGYDRIYEAPVKIESKFSSSVKLLGKNSVQESFLDTLAIFYRLKILRYYDDCNKRKWVYDPDLNFRVNVG